MTFIVEDGTGLEDSTAYASVEESDTFLGDDWAPTVEEKESSIIAGSDYVDLRWGPVLRSCPLLTTQNMEFPRLNLYDRYGRLVEGVPDDLKKATLLYSQEAFGGTLYAEPVEDVTGLRRHKTVVGPVTEDKSFGNEGNKAPAGSDSYFIKFPQADRYMQQYINAENRVIRA